MTLFDHPEFAGHEEVAFCHDKASGLRAIIAIHDTTLGPALGGCRMWPYGGDGEALTDVLRLSKGMTYKAALAGLALGGGKTVIIGDPRQDKTEARLEALGRFIETLGGRYVTAEDVGITVRDVQVMGRATSHVAGIPEKGSGDPSPATAWGVFSGLKACVRHKLGREDLSGLRVAVQGLGAVGYELCRHLAAAGAELLVADLDPERTARAGAEFQAKAVPAESIHAQAVDIFAPCALGGVINDRTLPELKAAIVAGSANNQLAAPRHGALLAQAGHLYAPDYVLNAGGIINISHEGPDYDEAKAFAQVARIGATLSEIFRLAEAQEIATADAADALAEARLEKARQGKAPSKADPAKANPAKADCHVAA